MSVRWKRINESEGDVRYKAIRLENLLERVLQEGLDQLIQHHGVEIIIAASAKYCEEKADQIIGALRAEIDDEDMLDDQEKAEWKENASDPRSDCHQELAAILEETYQKLEAIL